MSELVGSFISIDESNKNSVKSSIQQLVDIVQSDIASISSTTRKSYEVFVSGGVNLSTIKSSLYQTIYDQDFTLGTSNPLFDISMGSYAAPKTGEAGKYIVDSIEASTDSGGKLLFENNTAMMREKVHIYKQFAHTLLGSENEAFVAPHGEVPPATPSNDPSVAIKEAKKINGALFICFRRLFARDNIYKGSFGMKLHKKASLLYQDFVSTDAAKRQSGLSITNISKEADLNSTDENISVTYNDKIATTNITVTPVAGEVSTIMDESENPIGLIYYDSGIIVLDVERALDAEQIVRGLIDSTRTGASSNTVTSGPFYVYGDDGTNGEGYYYPLYKAAVGDHDDDIDITIKDANGDDDANPTSFKYNSATASVGVATRPSADANGVLPALWTSVSDVYYSDALVTEVDGKTLHNGKFYPGLWVSGTIDTVLDHVCNTRFGRGNKSAMSFRNETVINSSLIFCRAAPSQLNYSSNPTYTNSDGNIIALNSNKEPFSFVTTVGLYDAERFLLAVAKTSRPIEKNPETDLSIRIRLDY